MQTPSTVRRNRPAVNPRPALAMASQNIALTAIESCLGWIALSGGNGQLRRLVFGFDSAASAIKALGSDADARNDADTWLMHLASRLREYAAGSPVDFSDVHLGLLHLTTFQRKVVRHCRRIAYGQTMSYGQLAAAAGAPGAARAVGNVMAHNRHPLIVPCHRVIGSDGRLGGFSAPSGLTMKARLLELERRV